MQGFIYVTGMVLKQSAVGEYDRRISLLTKERGKISAFVRGARKPGNRLAAAANPFSFGNFKLYQGQSSYTVAEADIQNYFEQLRVDFEGAYYGIYFAEIADYYTRENNDERQMLKLLYQSLKALTAPSLLKPLVKAIYECKAIAVNGEFPGAPRDMELSDSARYAIEYIQKSSIEKLYTFTVSESVLAELIQVADRYRRKFMPYDFKSLEILQTLS
ncbi:MAG: DNA repair protein RecO [Roseburia sp.]|nr:DNA repair protein RecO [Roseburia sp.]